MTNNTFPLEREMDYWNWRDKFRPVLNRFDATAGLDGCLFKPFGEEWDFVRTVDSEFVWSLTVSDDGDETYWEISNGIRIVNHEGYIVTCIPCYTENSIEY